MRKRIVFFFRAVRVVYANFFCERPKLPLFGIIAIFLYSCTSVYFGALKIGLTYSDAVAKLTGHAIPFQIHGMAILLTLLTFLCWQLLVASFWYIDCERRPKRITRLMARYGLEESHMQLGPHPTVQ